MTALVGSLGGLLEERRSLAVAIHVVGTVAAGRTEGDTPNTVRALSSAVNHDRIHAREPTHDAERWSVGTVERIGERDGHCVVTVRGTDGETVELVVTFAVRDLFLRRLDLEEGESPVGATVWYRKRGG